MSRLFATLFALALTAMPVLACGGPDDACALPTGNYHLATPDGVAPKGIVMHLHGGGGRGRGLLNSGLAREALARGYVFVAPDGDQPTRRFKRDWSVRGKGLAYDRKDFEFLPEVLADVRARNGCDARQPERNSFEGDLWFRHWTDCAQGDIRLMLHKGGHGAPQGWAARVMDWFEGKGLDAEG